jgi:hypothetical protein
VNEDSRDLQSGEILFKSKDKFQGRKHLNRLRKDKNALEEGAMLSGA